MLNLSKLVPALAAGNTVVLKPAPDTPVERHVDRQASSPRRPTSRRAWSTSSPSADPAEVGDVLTGDPRVDMISLHRLDRGRQAHHGAAARATLKRVFLELGGKSANIVLDDADFPQLDARARAWCACTRARAARSPPACCSRASRYDEGVEIVKAAFESFPYGDPTTSAT